MPERKTTSRGAEDWRPSHFPRLPSVWDRADFVPQAVQPAPRAPSAPEPRTAAQPDPLAVPVEKDPKVTLSGRVTKQPLVRRTRKGQLVAQFPLAVALDDQTTEEHTVLAFGERATKVGKGLQPGDDIELIGYDHRHTTTAPDGTPQDVREVYAARIIRVEDRQVVV